MKRILVKALFIAVLLGLVVHYADAGEPGTQTQPRFIELYYLSPDTETRFALKPDDLIRAATGRITFDDVQAAENLYNVTRKDVRGKGFVFADSRWGVIIRSESRVQLGSFFIDSTGRKGYYNGSPSLFGGKLLRRLKALCPIFD
jgi:hypothetical protein